MPTPRNFFGDRPRRYKTMRNKPMSEIRKQKLHAARRHKAARAEAKALLIVEANGCGRHCTERCRSVADVMEITYEMHGFLKQYMCENPEDAPAVREALDFRRMVADELTRLRAGGARVCNIHQRVVQVVDGREMCRRCVIERRTAA